MQSNNLVPKDSSESDTSSDKLKSKALSQTSINSAAATTSSILTLLLTHPGDTAVKLKQIGQWRNPKLSISGLSSLYQGFLPASILGISHRVIKYAGEPFVNDFLHQIYPQGHPVLKHILSGAFVGGIEAGLAPLSTLKTLKQTDLHNRSCIELLKTETHYFKSAPIIYFRNVSGTAVFFGTESAMREWVYGVRDGDPLSFKQKMMNATICPTFGIIFSYPADTIKTLLQSDAKSIGMNQVFKNLMSEQGVKGFYKGLSTRLLFTVPRGGLGYLSFQIARDGIKSIVANQDVEKKSNVPHKMNR